MAIDSPLKLVAYCTHDNSCMSKNKYIMHKDRD